MREVNVFWRTKMNSSGNGVLPMQELVALMEAGYITGIPHEGEEGYVNPASIDLPLSSEAYRLDGSFLLGEGELVRDWIKRVGGTPHDLASPLERGIAYLIRIQGSWSLPASVYGYANPKSSTGRLNVLSRMLADNVDKYDALTHGWKGSGEIWVLVRADSFPVVVHEGLALSQLRLFTGKAFLSEYDMELVSKKDGLLFKPNKKKIPFKKIDLWGDALVLSIAVGPDFGWHCPGTRKPLNLRTGGKRDDYFEPVTVKNGIFLLRKGAFYIASTLEHVMVAPHLSAELRAIDYRFGEMQVHRAGYIDSGWGYGEDGSVRGRPITLEVTPHEDIYIRNGQAIGRLRYEHMHCAPDVPYDAAASNYSKQDTGAMLSKYLK